MPTARLTCIMPFLDEAIHLPAVLASLRAQTIDPARVRLVAVDNGSSDAGPALVANWIAEGPADGLLVRDPIRSIPHALNVGLAHAAPEDIVVRLDAHTLYDERYLETIATAFETLDDDIWCVGGAPTPGPATGYLRRLGEALYSNPMGLGPADFRSAAAGEAPVRRVSTVYLGAWRPGILQRFGGFDERWAANEDCELTERLQSAGGAIARIPVRCGRISTRGPLATIRQWTRYGFWRAQTFKRYPRAIRPRHVVAPAALLVASALLASPRRILLVPLYVLYGFAVVAFRRAGEPNAITAGSLVFFPLVHVGYAAGLLFGAVRAPRSLRAGDAPHKAPAASGAPPSRPDTL